MLSRAALLCVALLGVTLHVTADAGGELVSDSVEAGTFEGRKLLTFFPVSFTDNSGNVWAQQGGANVAVNPTFFGKSNTAQANQNSAGNGNTNSIDQTQKNKGRKLQTFVPVTFTDNSGNVWAKQGGANVAFNPTLFGKSNTAQANQNSAGNGNTNSIDQTQKNKGRKLLSFFPVSFTDNSGNVWAQQSGVNVAFNPTVGGKSNTAQANQNSAGNGNTNSISQTQKNRG